MPLSRTCQAAGIAHSPGTGWEVAQIFGVRTTTIALSARAEDCRRLLPRVGIAAIAGKTSGGYSTGRSRGSPRTRRPGSRPRTPHGCMTRGGASDRSLRSSTTATAPCVASSIKTPSYETAARPTPTSTPRTEPVAEGTPVSFNNKRVGPALFSLVAVSGSVSSVEGRERRKAGRRSPSQE